MIRHSRLLALGFGLWLPILSALCLEDAAPPISFSEHLIADNYDYAYSLAAVDGDLGRGGTGERLTDRLPMPELAEKYCGFICFRCKTKTSCLPATTPRWLAF